MERDNVKIEDDNALAELKYRSLSTAFAGQDGHLDLPDLLCLFKLHITECAEIWYQVHSILSLVEPEESGELQSVVDDRTSNHLARVSSN